MHSESLGISNSNPRINLRYLKTIVDKYIDIYGKDTTFEININSNGAAEIIIDTKKIDSESLGIQKTNPLINLRYLKTVVDEWVDTCDKDATFEIDTNDNGSEIIIDTKRISTHIPL